MRFMRKHRAELEYGAFVLFGSVKMNLYMFNVQVTGKAAQVMTPRTTTAFICQIGQKPAWNMR